MRTAICSEGSQAAIAHHLGVSEGSLTNWMKQHEAERSGSGLSFEQKDELDRLRADIRRITTERDILRRATSFFSHGGSSTYEFVEREKRNFPVATLCEVMQVSRGVFYSRRNGSTGR